MSYPKLCFIIEDDSDDREIFLTALNEIDPAIQCMSAVDGKQGLEKLAELKDQVPDLIFIDLNMPRMNGMECLAAIKKMDNLKSSKIIMYSTTSDSKIINSTFDNGADNFLVKPASVKILIDALGVLFKKYGGNK